VATTCRAATFPDHAGIAFHHAGKSFYRMAESFYRTGKPPRRTNFGLKQPKKGNNCPFRPNKQNN
jgi:hypothetical protein